MKIRNATYLDAPAIKLLMGASGHQTTVSLLVGQIENLFECSDHQLIVCEVNKEVAGFVSIHYMPQLAFNNERVLISYLLVDDSLKDQGIAKSLEEYISRQALQRKCDCIQVLCTDWRTPACQFLQMQGYQECPRFYTKQLIYAEDSR